MNIGVSVALATYNGSCYIREQLDSIANQSALPTELVVSDDGSNDDTIDIIKDFSKQAPFEVVLLPPHARMGFADNFFHAATACRSGVVAFSDQDDVWDPDKLLLGSDALCDADTLLSLHTLTMTDEALKPVGLHRQGIERNQRLQPLELDPFSTGWGNSMVFRKVLLEVFPVSLRPRQPSAKRPLSHDTWIYTLAAALGVVAHIDQPLCLYRQHGSNTIGTKDSPLRSKLKGALTASVGRYREVESFYASMSAIFKQIAASSDRYRELALHAEERYAARQRTYSLRTQLYAAEGIGSRLAAYSKLHFAADLKSNEEPRSLLSMAKDIMVGISGLGILDESRT